MGVTKSFLGTCWGFPPEFSNTSNQVDMLSNEDDVHSSLQILLATMQGERVMRPDFGCNLDELVFESLTTTFKTYIKDLIATAILYYEPRIDVNKIELNDTGEIEGKILISVDYTIRSTNSRYNLVYPFYINQAIKVKI